MNRAFAKINFVVKRIYLESSLMTTQMAATVPNTPPTKVPIGCSHPEVSSHFWPSHTATPMNPAMVNVIPENLKKALGCSFDPGF